MLPEVTPSVLRPKVYDALKDLNGVLIGPRYDQKARILAHDHLRILIDGGYCAGCCMDWIRRVVQSDGNKNKISYTTELGSEKEVRNAVGAHRAAHLGNTGVTPEFKIAWEKLQLEHQAKVGQGFENKKIQIQNAKTRVTAELREAAKKDDADIDGLTRLAQFKFQAIDQLFGSELALDDAKADFEGFYREFMRTFDKRVAEEG